MVELRPRRRSAPFALLLMPALLLFLAACDTADPDPVGEVAIQGTVTATADHSQQPGSDDAVEGATVTAASVGAGGQLQTLDGQATTDAQGNFSLTTTASPQPIRLHAQTVDGFRAATVLEAGAAGTGGTITAPPMNVQSTAAADVFVDARAVYPNVTAADAALHVDAGTAAAIHAGMLSVEPVAASMAAAAEAESGFALHAGGAGATQATVDAARDHRNTAYATFRTELAGATSAAAREAALETFFTSYGAAYSEAGMSSLHAGYTATAASGAGVRFASGDADHRFAMTHAGRMGAAMGAARSVEAEFEAAGASQARLATLTEARQQYLSSLRAATTEADISAAAAAYRNVVRTELAAEAEIPTSAVDAAFDATGTARSALDVAVAGAMGPMAVADAYAEFYGAAHAASHTALGLEGDFGANVVTSLSGL